jgi:hypothetical protein
MIATWLKSGRPCCGRRSTTRLLTSIAVAAALTLALCAAGLAGSASADVAAQIVERCERGESITGYTVKQYQHALHDMNTETIEYGDCSEVIQQAELAAAAHRRGTTGGGQDGGVGSPSTGGAAVEPTPAQQHILEATHNEHLAPVQLGGGGTVQPGVVHPDLASATSDLPTPVLVVIALVLAGLLLLAGKEIKERLSSEEQS